MLMTQRRSYTSSTPIWALGSLQWPSSESCPILWIDLFRLLSFSACSQRHPAASLRVLDYSGQVPRGSTHVRSRWLGLPLAPLAFSSKGPASRPSLNSIPLAPSRPRHSLGAWAPRWGSSPLCRVRKSQHQSKHDIAPLPARLSAE